MQPHKPFYERKLPHIQPQEGTFFVTYRLAGSLPLEVVNSLSQDYYANKLKLKKATAEEHHLLNARYFNRFDNALEADIDGPHWLREGVIAKIVFDSLVFNNGRQYELICFTILSNHVHALFTMLPGAPPLYATMQQHKRFTALQCNRQLNRDGQFWQHESYDHLVRDSRAFLAGGILYFAQPCKSRIGKRLARLPMELGMRGDTERIVVTKLRFVVRTNL